MVTSITMDGTCTFIAFVTMSIYFTNINYLRNIEIANVFSTIQVFTSYS